MRNLKKYFLIFPFLIFIFFANFASSFGPLALVWASQITKFEVYHSQKKEFSYQDVCQELGGNPNQTLLMGPHYQNSLSQLDCMGRSVDVKEFCLKKNHHQNDFLRGYIDGKVKKVICQRGNKIVLNLDCGLHENLTYCSSSNDGCLKLKPIYAHHLNLFHHSLTSETKKSKTLSCYFSTSDQLMNPVL